MNVLFLLSILCTFFINVQTTKLLGIIRNASLFLSPTLNNTIDGTTCQNCLCKILAETEGSLFTSFNCRIESINQVTCELFKLNNFITSSFYEIQTDQNSTFYFLELPPTRRMLFFKQLKNFFCSMFSFNSYKCFRGYTVVI